MAVPDQRERLAQLLARSWCEYDRLKDRDYVVRPAIPVLFFGDSNRYLSSPLKVVTVGLNPASAEFPDAHRFNRFPIMSGLPTGPVQRETSRHLAALDSYFRNNPYKQWFASFEPILTGLGCSFYGGLENMALHTDLCSPIATSPTWARLSPQQQQSLSLRA
ncbi:MAG TPA: hypothetical protein VMP68_08330 [Candidatus Eisenbacteria bacterium]|nr:hypothetical protein [Candidatus Eisenbacteria bacterium]